MTVRFKCSFCQAVLQARDTDAGKTARCKHCQTKLKIPAPRIRQPLAAPPEMVPGVAVTSVNRPTSHPSESRPSRPSDTSDPADNRPDEDPFGSLPAFDHVAHVVAKPRQVDDEFRDALIRSHVVDSAASSQSAPEQSGESTEAESMDDMVAAAIRQQQQRNRAAAASKITVGELQRAFVREMEDFDAAATVNSRSTSVAITVLVLPMAFSMAVAIVTLAMIALPLGWLPIGFGTVLTYGGLIWYPLAWGLLLAAWIPVFNLGFAAATMLFSGAEESEAGRTLTVENQPVMHEFVAQVCKKVGAPAPSRIDLDADFNASASFRRGWASFGKDELVLTLGIPLIACQSTGQLASVLAHEFGHFRQGSAMRSNYLIRSLTGWFIEKAQWGDFRAKVIDHYQASQDSNDSLLTTLSFIGFLGRQMMLGFGLAGHGLAGSLSREMEFDADRHAVHLAGTKTFIDSMARVERYGVAHAVTIENLRMLYMSGGILVDNIPRLMLHIGKTMPMDVIRRIADAKQTEKQERLDTHPPTRDRVNAAKVIHQPGVFRMDRPASDLIQNWNAMCHDCTFDFYSKVLDEPVQPDRLTPIEKVLTSEHKLLLDAN